MSASLPSEFDDLKRLIGQAEAGQLDEALGELLVAFEKHVRRLARQMLGKRLRKLLGTDDILQSVCLRLVTNLRDGQLNLRSEGEFVELLKEMTRHQVLDKQRHYHAQKRDLARERPLASPIARNDSSNAPTFADARSPSPSMELRGQERQQALEAFYAEVQRLLQADEWFLYKRRHIDGAKYAEIGAEFGLSEDAVRMRLKRINFELQPKLARYAHLFDSD